MINPTSSSPPRPSLTPNPTSPAATADPKDTATLGTERWREKLPAVMYPTAISRDGSLAASTDFWPGGTLSTIDTASGKAAPVTLPDKPESPLGIAPDNHTLAYVADKKGLTLYSLQTQKNVWQTPYQGNVVLPPAFSPDGSRIAMAGKDGPLVVQATDGKAVWEKPLGQIITTSEPAWSADGKTIAIVCTADDPERDRTVDVCDASTGKPAYKAVVEEQSPKIIDVRDRKTDAVVRKLKMTDESEKGGSFHLVDAASNELVYNADVEIQVANGMPAGMDYKIEDPKTGQVMFKAFPRKFEPEGPKPARLYLLDAASGQMTARPMEVGIGYDGANYWREHHLAFSPDGRSIAVTCNDGGDTSLSVYDIANLTKTWTSTVHGKTGRPVYNPDGSQIALTNLQFKQKDPTIPWLYPTQYGVEVFDASKGAQVADDVIQGSTDRDSVSAPFFNGSQVCAIDENQTTQEASLVAFPTPK